MDGVKQKGTTPPLHKKHFPGQPGYTGEESSSPGR